MDKIELLSDPDTNINIVKRFLHVLALLQRSHDVSCPESWNAEKLAAPPQGEFLEKIVNIYSFFVVKDSTREIIYMRNTRL